MQQVHPHDLRFTQDSIAVTFRAPYQNYRIHSAVEQIVKGSLSADEFPRMNVVRHGGVLWSLDNRRLWVFRKARVGTITVHVRGKNFCNRSQDFFRTLTAKRQNHLSNPAYFPHVRGERKRKLLPVEYPKKDDRAFFELNQHQQVEEWSNHVYRQPVIQMHSRAGSWEDGPCARPSVWNRLCNPAYFPHVQGECKFNFPLAASRKDEESCDRPQSFFEREEWSNPGGHFPRVWDQWGSRGAFSHNPALGWLVGIGKEFSGCLQTALNTKPFEK